MLTRASSDEERKLPIDASEVFGPSTTASEFRLTLPEGWRAQLPKGIVANSAFGEYRSDYTQDGRVLRISHRIVGANGVYPKERYGELRAWLKSVGDDAVESIVLSPPPNP
jgi:hypothetical protein